MKFPKLQHISLLILILLMVPSLIQAQISGQTIVRGRITDAATNEPVPLVAVVFVKTITGTTSDIDGKYILTGKKFSNRIQVSCLGYETAEFPVLTGQTQSIDIRLKPQTKQLNEVVIKPKKSRYKNRDNPAVQLINLVIAHKDANRKEQLNSFSYEKYDKTQFALSNLTEEFKSRKFLKKFKFIFNNVDTGYADQIDHPLPIHFTDLLPI